MIAGRTGVVVAWQEEPCAGNTVVQQGDYEGNRGKGSWLGFQLLAGCLAEGFERGHGDEVGPAYAECFKLSAVHSALDPLVYCLTRYRWFNTPPRLFNAEVVMRVFVMAVPALAFCGGPTRPKACQRVTEVHRCQA